MKKNGKIDTTSESRKAISNALDSHLVIIVPKEEKENKAELSEEIMAEKFQNCQKNQNHRPNMS